jgi:hypothetical protein
MSNRSVVLEGQAAGSVGSNGEIKLTGFATVEGNASTAEAEVSIRGNAAVHGELARGVPKYRAAVPTDAFDRALYSNNNAALGEALEDGHLKLKRAETLHLEAGDYSLRSLRMVNDASITCEGRVRIFVEDVVRLSNAASLGSPGECDLTVLSETTGRVSMSNEARAAAAVFAPLAAVTMSNGTKLEGSLVGRSVKLTGDASILAASSFGVECEPNTPDDPQDETGTTGGSTSGGPDGDTGDLPPLPDLPH